MKGLLLKDFYNLSGQLKIYLFIPLMAAFFCYQQQDLSFAQFMLSIIIMFIPSSAFAYDEMCGFDSYAMTLPITRKDFVLSRYVLALLSAICIGFIACLLAFVLTLIFGVENFQNVTWKSFLQEEIAVCLAVNAVVCILLPLLFKFGNEKGRVFLFIIFLGVGVIPIMFQEQLSMLSFDNINTTMLIGSIAVLLVVLEIVSFYISMRIVKKKEF